MLTVSLLGAGCILDAAPVDDGDSAVGEAQEAMSSFTEPIKFNRLKEIRQYFSVPNRGVVTVAAHARWDRPAQCRLPTYKIELVEKGTILDTGAGARAYPTSGAPHTETWSGLGAGRYYFMLSSTNDNPYCEVVGTMNVTIKP
jgi:hypothetical protein